MCLTANIEQIKQHFSLSSVSAVLIPRYNISPGQHVVIIKGNCLEFSSWGVKFDSLNNIVINARVETIRAKKAFNLAFKKQRCLIVANGFFEWKTVGKQKIPFYIQSIDREILAFAGIFMGDSCIIITTAVEQSATISNIHQRMPVIVNKNSYHLWLNSKTATDLLLDPSLCIQSNTLEAYPVSTQVNNPKFDNQVCIQSLT